MAVLAVALLILPVQDPAVGPVAPPVPSSEVTVSLPPFPDPPSLVESPAEPKAAAAPVRRLDPSTVSARARGARRLADPVEGGPSIGGFVVWTGVVMALMVGAFLLVRRFTRRSRFFSGAEAINVLARRSLGQRQEIFLVEVGTKVFMIGSTRERLNTLGEFSQPDEVAVLRSHLPRRKEDSTPLVFRDSLREGIRREEAPGEGKVYESIVGELAEIRRTVRAWRA